MGREGGQKYPTFADKLSNWWGTGSKAPNNFVDVVYGGPLVIPALTHLIAAASHSLKSQD